jgi:Holliday junction DNA helicase RuvA
MALYGFYKELERRLFKHCITVNGVGVSTGLLILSSLPPEQLMNTIITENVAMLRAVKGIGEKTAMRIIIELKDKMAKEEPGEAIKIGVSHNTKREEALSGLVVLGFARLHAAKIVDKLLNDNPNISVESLIKESLRIL